MHLHLLLLPLFGLSVEVDCRTECFIVHGRLRCPTNPRKAVGVLIDLMDEDPLPGEIDDTMGRTWSKTNGLFTVSGCGSDFGPFNSPDGYLRIKHSCPHYRNRSIREIEVDVLPVFMPRVINLGPIDLDRYEDDSD
ncbi:unnamed protein product [Nippostrongylus brasiliensis]|uniref:Transthyretin-like protein 52 (inferred by orthology to a C. elegans protein) n=1 Tax=Nippostrongylus brasiliensis TaxID=27835 RepID=A0A0N4YB10_NIPBR|nr:unnamed protein product [Nippostrongylus brasiliensis]